MFRVFNCGIGMVVITDEASAEQLGSALRKEAETVYRLGSVRAREGDETQTVIV